MSAADACNPWYRVQDPEQDLSKAARKQVWSPGRRGEHGRTTRQIVLHARQCPRHPGPLSSLPTPHATQSLQVDKPVVRDEEPRSAATHNLWTGRRLGGKAPERERKGSQHRCRPKVDVGKTRGSQACIQQFCLYFAR